MQRRLISVILFAVLAAGISSMLLYRIMASSSGNGKTAHVLTAIRDMAAGDVVSAADLRTAEWPVTGGAHWIEHQPDIVGRALLVPVAKDEPFAANNLAAKGAGGGVAARIPAGMRLISVHVDELTGLSRFILPGMHVDVIATGVSSAGGSAGMVSRTILQNIEVFSTGQSVERDVRDKAVSASAFNLLVTPQQALTLSQAVAQSKIELVLRNPLDRINFVPDPADEPKPNPLALANPNNLRAVLQTAAQAMEPKAAPAPATAAPVAPPPPVAPPTPTVEVIQGTKRTVSAVVRSESR